MSVRMYDGISALAQGIASQGNLVVKVAGYDTGRYAWNQSDWDLFPNADHVHIATYASANTGDVLDVEAGDASPGQSAGWIAMRKAAGLFRPTIYCSRFVIPAVRAGTGNYILGRDYDIWVADYTGQPHEVVAPGLPAAVCAATQYTSTTRWDLSEVYDTGWPHRKPPADPGLAVPTGLSVTLHGRMADFGWAGDPASTSYGFQVFHHNARGLYGSAVVSENVQGTHVEGFHLPGGGQYACRVRAQAGGKASAWTAWKVF